MATDFTVDRDTVKYVLNSSGDIASVAIDTPAIEYNTDGTYKGLLVEPASTNICKQSENISTTWAPNDATPTQSTEETPDGDTSSKFIKLADNNTGGGAKGYVQVYQTLTVAANTKYTASVFFKADQLSFAQLLIQDYDGGTDAYQYFNLSTGAKGTAVNLNDSKIEAYPNGWYRCSVTWTQGAADTSFTFVILVADSISNNYVDLDGTSSIFVWGAQVEASPIATSYIPTTTASVTRNKDDISLTGASDLIGQSEGTLYVEVDWKEASGTYQFLLSLNDGTLSNRIVIYNTIGGSLFMFAAADGTILTQQGELSSGYSGIQKIAFAYKSGDFELYRNGSSISSESDPADTLATLATLTDIDLGQFVNEIYQANMHIRAVALYKERLSDAQCIALTS
jgi:hypothetical protein